jgi:hypothetical protein
MQLALEGIDLTTFPPCQYTNYHCSLRCNARGSSCLRSCQNVMLIVLVKAQRLLVDSKVCPIRLNWIVNGTACLSD